MTEFDDIRPYNDSEVPAVIARLLDDKEFLNLLLTRKAPILTKLPLVKMFARPFIKKSLQSGYCKIWGACKNNF